MANGQQQQGFDNVAPIQQGFDNVTPLPPPPEKSFNEKITERQEWPKFDSDHPVASSIRTIGVALGNLGAGAIGSTEGLASFIKDAADPRVTLTDFYKRNIATIPDALKAVAQADAAGHPEYALGQLLPGIAASEFGPELPGAKGVRESIGEATRDPVTGKIKPSVRTASRLTGAGVGGGLFGGGGAVAGAMAGPGLADMLLPEHPNPTPKLPKVGPKPLFNPDVEGATATNAPNLPRGNVSSLLGAKPSEVLSQPPNVKFVSQFEAPEPSKIVEPGSEPPPVNKTLVSYGRSALVDMIKDPSTTYADRIAAIRELRRNPGGVPKSVIDSFQKYMTEPGAGTRIYGGPQQ